MEAALSFLAAHRKGVLVTLKRDGRPQLSNVLYGAEGSLVRVSVTETRAKTRNLQRDPRAALHVTSEDFWSYVVVEGVAELVGPTTEPGDATGRELAALYEQAAGRAHPDWDEFYRAMVDERRMVLRLPVDHAYGQLRG